MLGLKVDLTAYTNLPPLDVRFGGCLISPARQLEKLAVWHRELSSLNSNGAVTTEGCQLFRCNGDHEETLM